MNKYYAWIIGGLLLCFISIWFWRNYSHQPLEKYKETKEFFGVPVSIDVCVPKGTDSKKTARVLDDLWQLQREHFSLFSLSNPGNDVDKIHTSFRNPQLVSAQTISLLKESLRLQTLTQGQFSVLVKSYADLWRLGVYHNRLPSPQEFTLAKTAARTSNLRFLLGNRIEILNAQTRVDLSLLFNGYVVDKSVALLRNKGVRNFLLDIGADMYASGHNCGYKPWTIAVRNPRDGTRIVDVIQVADQAVSTTGSLNGIYTIQGRHFSSLINPQTGKPQPRALAATVIAEKSLDADALATALAVIDPQEAITLLEKNVPQSFAVIVAMGTNHQWTIYKSSKYSRLQINQSSKR